MWGKGVTIAHLRGVDIKLDASWFLIAILIVWSLRTSYFPAILPGAGEMTLLLAAIVAMLGLFASLILHELAHAEVAGHFGLRVSGITLFLFGGVAELPSEPADGASEFWIAIAGPIASMCLSLVFWFSAGIASVLNIASPVFDILAYLAGLNLLLALFNLLPAFPMDGGRILRAWLWSRSGDLLAATRRATSISAGVAYGLMGLGLWVAFSGAVAAGLWPVLIGLFLLATSQSARAQIEARVALRGSHVRDFMSQHPRTARPDQTLADLVNLVFLKHGTSFVPIVEEGVLLGYVDLGMVRKIDREHWTTTTVEDVFEGVADDNAVPADLPGPELVKRITQTGRRKYLVTHENRLAGVVTLADLQSYLTTHRGLS